MKSKDMSFEQKTQECKCGLPRGAHPDDGPIKVDHLGVNCKGFVLVGTPEKTDE